MNVVGGRWRAAKPSYSCSPLATATVPERQKRAGVMIAPKLAPEGFAIYGKRTAFPAESSWGSYYINGF
jgi:hypothetical protein